MNQLLPEHLGKIQKGVYWGLIPARGGSQRVKNKNILPLGDKPLLAYTVEAALKTPDLNRVIVSTDSKEIAEVAKKFGAEVPFLRPQEISNSSSTEFEFHEHALFQLYQMENVLPEYVVNLYPTTPFRKSETIQKAIEKTKKFPDAHSLRSTRAVSEHPYKMWQMEGEYLRPFVQKEDGASHTAAYHLLPQVQIQNASIYIVKTETLLRFRNTVGKMVLNFEMTEEESVDINTPLDFKLAETVLAENKKQQY